MTHFWSVLGQRGGDMRRPAHEARPQPRRGNAAALSSRDRQHGPFSVSDLPGVALGEFAMHAARRIRARVVGHEQRHLMSVIKVIEIHSHAPSGKREHVRSLSRVGLRSENPRDARLIP